MGQVENKALTPSEKFKKYFDIELADTPEKKQKVYNIRYRVYCQEFGYESTNKKEKAVEIDEYDSHALHCLITHKSTQIPAACVRLVPKYGEKKVKLPFEKYCHQSLNSELIKNLNLDQTKECEISRLAVDWLFRKHTNERKSQSCQHLEHLSKEEKSSFIFIAVATFFGAIALTELSNKTNMFAMMEPFLPRLLNRSGLFFQKVGETIDYHGIRIPYFLTTQSAVNNIRPELIDLYQWVYKKLACKLDVQVAQQVA